MNSTASITVECKFQKGHWEHSHYISIGITGKWTKWGGRVYTVAENQYESKEEKWICQSCSKEQPKILNPYKFEYPKGEYLNVCSACFFENCIELFNRILI